MPEPLVPSTEEIMYRRWEEFVSPGSRFVLRDGGRLVVMSRGVRNRGAGPDYTGALLLIDGRLRSGAVEMHRHESEWYLHGHQRDPAYRDVILHVVAVDSADRPVDLPTLHYDRLGKESNPLPGLPEEERTGISADLLADYSWQRLLRRTEHVLSQNRSVGEEQGIDPPRLRRSFLRLAIEGLGYHENREPMRRLADAILSAEDTIESAACSGADAFERVASTILSCSGIDPDLLWHGAGTAYDQPILRRILKSVAAASSPSGWWYQTRPGNRPERRIWGAVDLVLRLYRDPLMVNLAGRLTGRGVSYAAEELVVRHRTRTFIGPSRATELVVNGLIPVVLAGALAAGSTEVVEASCRAWREAPSLPTNRLLVMLQERYLQSRRIVGAFWQQGAIEMHQSLYDRNAIHS